MQIKKISFQLNRNPMVQHCRMRFDIRAVIVLQMFGWHKRNKDQSGRFFISGFLHGLRFQRHYTIYF